jgi:hypothetical protein
VNLKRLTPPVKALPLVPPNLDLLTAAPWQKCGAHDGACPCLLLWSRTADVAILSGITEKTPHFEEGVSEEAAQTNLAFAAIARNAFDGDPEALAWWEAHRVKAINVEATHAP